MKSKFQSGKVVRAPLSFLRIAFPTLFLIAFALGLTTFLSTAQAESTATCMNHEATGTQPRLIRCNTDPSAAIERSEGQLPGLSSLMPSRQADVNAAISLSSGLDSPQQSRTGPVPPLEVLERDARKPSDRVEDMLSAVSLPVPAYGWRHGCGPTALGMIVGYYDTVGYGDLIPGSASSQTGAVSQAIASGGDGTQPFPPGSERHYEDYARPQDSYPTMLADDYITSGRAPHDNNSLADYMNTSKSTHSNFYGWSWSNDVGPAFVNYVNQQNPAYAPRFQEYRAYNGTLTWSVLTSEIDAGRPMVFLVDTDGDGGTDHFISIIGYRTSPSLQYGSWDTWSTTTVRWENFASIASGVPWGIWGGWALNLDTPAPLATISGRITINGNNGLAGVTISDGGGHSTTTGSDGRYTLSGLPAGTYTIRASKTGYVFSPVSRSVTVPPNATGVDFTGVVAYQVSGQVKDPGGLGIAGVTVSAGTRQATTDNNGNYAITGLDSGSFTVTPSKSGYTFCPRSRAIAVPPNQTSRNFTGSPVGTDLGFCPDPNGFGFANKRLWRTWPMFEQFYGSNQVRKPDGSICGEAQRYFDQTYRGVANGWSCVGFTLASVHSYQGRPQPNAGPFAIAHHDRLYEQAATRQLTDPVAYYSGVQLSQQFQSEYQSWLATCTTDPNQMVERLRQAIQAGSPLLLDLKAGDVFHSITPYRIVTVSSNETHIYVYDSEAPGQQQVVRMQRSGSGWQWQYTFTGSLAGVGTRTGGCRDMVYYRATTSLERGIPLVDLCQDAGASASERSSAPASTNRMLTVLPATGDWIIRDTAGHRLGWTGGQWVAEIPAGYELPQTLGDATRSYRSLYLPAGSYTVQASATSSHRIGYSLFADGRVLEVNSQTSSAGMIGEIAVSPGLDAIAVSQPASLRSLLIDVTYERPTASHIAGLMGSAISGNDNLAISFDGEKMHLSRAGGGMEYRLRFFQPGRSSGYFVTEPITLGADEAHTLRPSNWNGLSASTVVLEIDEGRNGTIDETVMLENTARSIFLPRVLGS